MRRVLLIADSDISVLLTLKVVLEISGFKVHTATSAAEAISMIKRQSPDIVLTRNDLDFAGREVAKAANQMHPKNRVIVLSRAPLRLADWEGIGILGSILLPIQTKQLVDSLERLLGDSRQSPDTDTCPAEVKSADDPYALLGLARPTTKEMLNKAFRAKAAVYHPDKYEHLALEMRQLAEKRMTEFNAAFDKIARDLE